MLVILSCCEKPTLHSSMTSIYWRDIYWGIGKPKKPVQQISRIIRYLQQLWAYSEQTRSDSSIILLRCMVIVLSQCICDTPRCLSTIAFLPTAPDRWPCGFYIHTSSDRIGQVSLCPKEASSHAVSKIWLKHHGKYLLVFREPCFMLPGPLCLLCHKTNISLLKLLLPEGLLGDRFLGPAPDILTLYVKNGLGMCILTHVILCEEISILYMRFVTYQILWILRASSEVFSVLYARSGLFSDSLKTAAS